MDLKKDWYKNEFINHELPDFHRDIENELTFYSAIADGNMELVKSNCQSDAFLNPEGMGQLSLDPVQNIRYHFVVTTAFAIRYCIHSGLEHEKAYGLSDFYIMKMDQCKTIEEIAALHDTMCIDLCKQMMQINRKQVLSKPVVLCHDYIYKNIHYRITVDKIADHLQLSRSYLSKLFKKEMGISLSQYILDLKIQKAVNLLKFSDFTITDIANYLSFSSESHFIQVFEKKMGTSPYKYRVSHFRTTWQADHS